jgi:3-carboxy-cis,cis-muconate cycloisomerase
MPASVIDSIYYRDMFGTAAMRSIFSDERRIEIWLEVEVALARAEARLGVIPQAAAERIAAAARIENIDFKAMKAEFDQVGFPIMPLVHQLAKSCDPESARWVHYGSTTQDILDTGMALQIRAGIALIEADLDGVINALARLARAYRDTVMPGRTFQQQAAPITFGYKVAVWLAEMHRHLERLPGLKRRALVGQCGGAVGTLATLGDNGLAVRREMMAELGLGEPVISWHTARDGWAEVVFWLSMQAATLGKIATEIAMLMRTEVGEVSEPFEPGRGASTTLPQKRNPISCEPVIAIAHRLRECVGSQLMAMIQEHERAVGPMHLEWIIIPEAFVLTAGAFAQSRQILEELVVDDQRMRENLGFNGGLIMSEAVMMGLAPKIGRNKAHEVVYAAAGRAMEAGITLREALVSTPEITSYLTVAEIEALLEPVNYTGAAGDMIDAVLALVEKKESG